MAAPATTTRIDPTDFGRKLADGYSTKIAFSVNPKIEFWEKTVGAPGTDGGDAIDTTTMFNSTWRTMAARSLKTLKEFTVTAAYDPEVMEQINAIINVEGSVTINYPDGSTYDFFGYLRDTDPDQLEEGTQPEMTLTIQPTNYDPVNCVEAAPVMTEVSGT